MEIITLERSRGKPVVHKDHITEITVYDELTENTFIKQYWGKVPSRAIKLETHQHIINVEDIPCELCTTLDEIRRISQLNQHRK